MLKIKEFAKLCGTSTFTLRYYDEHEVLCPHETDPATGYRYYHPDQQKDMERRLPMETGIIDTRDILARFKAAGNDALYMIEPFEPARTRFHDMTPEAAVAEAAAVFARLEK